MDIFLKYITVNFLSSIFTVADDLFIKKLAVSTAKQYCLYLVVIFRFF